MATLYTLTGFAFTPLTGGVSNIQASTLEFQGSDDLEFTFNPIPGNPDGATTLEVTQGEVYGTELDGLTPNLTSAQWTAGIAEATQGGVTTEYLIFNSSDLGRAYAYVLSGPVPSELPTEAELLAISDVLVPVDSGPFAPGTAFSPAAAASAVVDPDPFAGTAGPDVIQGFASNDVIDGEGGDDNIAGNFGNDTILGGAGADFIEGEGGNDDINSGPGGDTVSGGGGLDIIRGTPADFDQDLITGLDFGDLLVIEGVSPDNILLGPDSNEILIETTGDDTPEASFTYSTASFGFGQTIPELVAEAQGGNTILQLDPALAPDAGIGTGIQDPRDFGQIGNFLFAANGANTIVPVDIFYVGAVESLALLEDGYAINEISGETPIEVVGIDRGVFLSSGGNPGTENTETGFSVDLREPGDPRLDAAVLEAFPFAGTTNDASLITFTFDAEQLGDAPSISFDLFFGSDEFPEFVDSSFVDIAAVFVNGVNYALFNNDPGQPVSIVGQSINTPGNFYDNNGDDGSDSDPFTGTFDTEYDGFSVLLNVVAPVQPGINTVTIGVADSGDSILDSGIFVGNIQTSDLTVGGSFVQTNGTSGDDSIDANGAPQLITLGGGADTVSGSASELNGDNIVGFGEDDSLVVEGATFTNDDLTVTMGSAIIDIDTDGDGVADTTVTLQGNYQGAEFNVENTDGNSVITATDVPGSGLEVTGTEGAETLVGTDGDDTLIGLGGDDLLTGGGGNDLLQGGDGNDGLQGQDGDDTLEGGAGNDNLSASDGNDLVLGGEGNDRMGGGLGNDDMQGGAGDDFMGGGLGDDTVDGGDDNDVVNGGGGNDVLIGGAGDDTMGGSFNNDSVNGGAGNDDMGGGFGQDTISGGEGNDSAGGGEGNDSINGGAGNDFLAGGGRDDTINGGTGDDTINGGDGDDIMTGGAGADEFVFNFFKDGDADVITDFEDGIDSFRMTGVENAPGSGLQGRLDALNITDTDGGALIDYQGHTVLIEGVAAADLGLEDFTFL